MRSIILPSPLEPASLGFVEPELPDGPRRRFAVRKRSTWWIGLALVGLPLLARVSAPHFVHEPALRTSRRLGSFLTNMLGKFIRQSRPCQFSSFSPRSCDSCRGCSTLRRNPQGRTRAARVHTYRTARSGSTARRPQTAVEAGAPRVRSRVGALVDHPWFSCHGTAKFWHMRQQDSARVEHGRIPLVRVWEAPPSGNVGTRVKIKTGHRRRGQCASSAAARPNASHTLQWQYCCTRTTSSVASLPRGKSAANGNKSAWPWRDESLCTH